MSLRNRSNAVMKYFIEVRINPSYQLFWFLSFTEFTQTLDRIKKRMIGGGVGGISGGGRQRSEMIFPFFISISHFPRLKQQLLPTFSIATIDQRCGFQMWNCVVVHRCEDFELLICFGIMQCEIQNWVARIFVVITCLLQMHSTPSI